MAGLLFLLSLLFNLLLISLFMGRRRSRKNKKKQQEQHNRQSNKAVKNEVKKHIKSLWREIDHHRQNNMDSVDIQTTIMTRHAYLDKKGSTQLIVYRDMKDYSSFSKKISELVRGRHAQS